MTAISVLMSVYNECEVYLRQSIESILKQRFTDFEFIIINDNPDKELNNELLDEYAKKDNRIKIYTNSKNEGLIRSLNFGITKCKGKYIARMDADDISDPRRLYMQYKYLEKYPEVYMTGTAYKIFGNEKGYILTPGNLKSIKTWAIFNSPFCHPSVMFRNTGEFIYENYIHAEDYALWIKIMQKYKVYNLPHFLLNYRSHGSNISKYAGKKTDERSHTIISIQKQVMAYWGAADYNSYSNFIEGSLAIRDLGKEAKEEHLSNVLGNYKLISKKADQFILGYFYFINAAKGASVNFKYYFNKYFILGALYFAMYKLRVLIYRFI